MDAIEDVPPGFVNKKQYLIKKRPVPGRSWVDRQGSDGKNDVFCEMKLKQQESERRRGGTNRK